MNEITNTYKITGYEALRISARENIQIYTYANPIDDGGPISYTMAVNILKDDPSLIYINVTPNGSWRSNNGNYIDGEGRNANEYFQSGEWLGPDDDGIEPSFNDATKL